MASDVRPRSASVSAVATRTRAAAAPEDFSIRASAAARERRIASSHRASASSIATRLDVMREPSSANRPDKATLKRPSASVNARFGSVGWANVEKVARPASAIAIRLRMTSGAVAYRCLRLMVLTVHDSRARKLCSLLRLPSDSFTFLRRMLMPGLSRRWLRGGISLLSVLGCVLVPALARAQSSLTGVVRDAPGAVLPGVTVEASSPVLIEKVRTAVTDGTGQYRLAELPPGPYSLTFTLTGFSVVKRDGVEVSGSGAVITINADLRVGGVQETITVTGETPVVDVQSSTRQQVVLDDSVITALPASRGYGNLLTAVPGIQNNS